ncbi:GNAT family N-acetyltransferase [Nocardia takedensis]
MNGEVSAGADRGGSAAIRAAGEADLPVLREIEVAAGAPFAAIGMTEIAEDDPPTLERLRAFAEAGRAWVWIERDEPVAYLVLGVVDGAAHIEQVSVRPDFAGRRIGLALIRHAARWALARGIDTMTLTTFTEVPWNGPYYRRAGFREIAPADLGPRLRAIREAEVAHGLDRTSPRTAMRAACAEVLTTL